MKKFAAMTVAMLIAVLGLAMLAPSAQAATGYPEPTAPSIDLTSNKTVVVSGKTFLGVVTASIQCDSLQIEWNGVTEAKPGDVTKHTFTAPKVSVKTVIPLRGTCTYGTTTSGSSGHAIMPHSQVLHAQDIPVTVYPTEADLAGNNGQLADTGGPSVGWLIGGVAALLAGGAAMLLGTRRRSSGVSN